MAVEWYYLVTGVATTEKCTDPKEVGKCGEKLARWAFSDNKCTPFYYTGCEGNSNNYRTEQECQTSCPEEKGVVIVCLCVPLFPQVMLLIPIPLIS